MVNSLAAMSTGRPSSRRVAEVTGPMEAMRTPSRLARRGPSSSTKFFTVEELVKVTTCGRLFGILQRGRRRARETLRHDGFVGFDDVDVSSRFAQFAGDDVAGDLGADQQDALPFYFSLQTADDGFGDVFLGNDVDFDAALLDGFFRGGADGGDAQTFRSG